MIKLESTASVLAQRIQNEILTGVLTSGQTLPQEDLSARYGVSRSPLREALRQLESEGWIIYRPNRGAIVASISADDVRQVYEVRRILEAGAIRLAASRIDKGQLKEARAMDAAARRMKETAQFAEGHYAFHRFLYETTANSRLVEAIFRSYVRIQRLPDAARRIRAVRRCAQQDHLDLLNALEAKNARKAEAATIAHLAHIESILLDGLP